MVGFLLILRGQPMLPLDAAASAYVPSANFFQNFESPTQPFAPYVFSFAPLREIVLAKAQS
jgi:hypothetical protein